MRSVLFTVLFAVLACSSAFFMVARPPVAQQCPAPIKAPPKMLFEFDDAALDNPAIAEDEKIEPARKCGFCMG